MSALTVRAKAARGVRMALVAALAGLLACTGSRGAGLDPGPAPAVTQGADEVVFIVRASTAPVPGPAADPTAALDDARRAFAGGSAIAGRHFDNRRDGDFRARTENIFTLHGRAPSAAAKWSGLQASRRRSTSQLALKSAAFFSGGADALAPSQGVLKRRNPDGEDEAVFPLKRTDVRAEASGWLATTEVSQTFGNPWDEVIEAVYVFPLPSDSAVNDFVMEVGGRRIVGVIRAREDAERLYAEARARGQTASLLNQERANVFTQHVANIEPGGTVGVHITYFHSLRFDEGAYEYHFPMVVAPRYIPGQATGGAPSSADAGQVTGGGGTAADTDQVPDASKVSPPVLPPHLRSGHDIGVTVSIEAGVAIEGFESASHDVQVRRDGPTAATVELLPGDAIANKDFVLRWSVAGEDVRPGFVAHRTEDGQGGFFSAFLVPSLDAADADVTPREVTFVMDTSGSMGGVPINTSKKLVRTALAKMRPYDRFNIIRFAGDSGSMAPAPVDVTDDTLAQAEAFLEGMKGAGGTEMLGGIKAWMDQPRDARYLRIVVFLTDGMIGNEEAILATIENEGSDARWFSFGIGSSVNRMLIEGIAEHGNGAHEIVLPREFESAEKAAARLFRRFDSPLLVDVEVLANGLPVTDLHPKRMRDLFAGEPIQVTGRYTGAAQGELLFRGRVGDRVVEFPVTLDLPEVEEGNRALAPVWARTRIHALTGEMLGKDGDARKPLEEQVKNLALEFRLVSAFTSFVAVDGSRVVGDGKPVRVLQPVPLAEDVSYEGAVGPPPGSMGVRVAGWGLTLAESDEGVLVVAVVDGDGAAQAAGVQAGQVLATFGRHRVQSAGHLEALVLQTSGESVEVGFRAGTDPKAPATTVSLRRP